MLPLLGQVFSPPIINIPPPEKQPWYESAFFLASIGFCATFFIAAVGMTTKGALTQAFFALAWVFGSISLWIVCQNVFKTKKLAWWILFGVALGILLGFADYTALHMR